MRKTEEEWITLPRRLFLFLLTGFVPIVVSLIIVFFATVLHEEGSVSSVIVVFIGPFPIVIGAGPSIAFRVIFSIIFAVLNIVMLLVIKRKI